MKQRNWHWLPGVLLGMTGLVLAGPAAVTPVGAQQATSIQIDAQRTGGAYLAGGRHRGRHGYDRSRRGSPHDRRFWGHGHGGFRHPGDRRHGWDRRRPSEGPRFFGPWRGPGPRSWDSRWGWHRRAPVWVPGHWAWTGRGWSWWPGHWR